MRSRTLSFLAAVAPVLVSSAVGCNGCSSSSGPESADSGAMPDVSVDTGMVESDSSTDSATGSDTSTPTGDAGTDGSSVCANGHTPTHLPSGFTQVAASAIDPNFGNGLSMALDENDDPMFAYEAIESAVETGTLPAACDGNTNPGGCAAVYFTRWDQCAGAFTTPVVIDPTVNFDGANPGTQLISVAYDLSTHEVGVAYMKTLPTDPNWADTYDVIMLATQKAGQTGFVTQQVSDNNHWGSTDVSYNDTPSLAMAGGNLYLAFTASFVATGCNNNICVRFASSTTTPPDAGADASAEAGPPPPHYFDLSYVPDSSNQYDQAQPRSDSISLALDAMGRPGVAFYEPLPGNNIPSLVYWRSDMASVVHVHDWTAQNDGVSVNLSFEQNSPRVAGLVSDSVDYGATYLSSSDEGTTWNAPEPLALSAGADFYSTFVADGHGNEVFTSHYNSSPNAAEMEAGCGTEPVVSRSTNSGAAFSGCTLNAPSVDTNGNLSSAFGASRVAGKFMMAGNVSGNGAATLDGGSGNSVVFYQDP